MGLTCCYLSGVLTVVQQVKTYSLECDANVAQAPQRPPHVQYSPAREKSSGKPASCAGPHAPGSRGSTYKKEIIRCPEMVSYFSFSLILTVLQKSCIECECFHPLMPTGKSKFIT